MDNGQDTLVFTICFVISLVLKESLSYEMDERIGYELPLEYQQKGQRRLNLVEGSNISITCVVKDENKTVDDLDIKFLDKPVNSTQIEILGQDRKRAKVHLTSLRVVPGRHNQILRCTLSDRGKGLIIPKHVIINVGRKPLQPSNVSCVVLDWCELKCNWLPSRPEQETHAAMFTTTYTLVYHQADEIGPVDCPKMTPTKDGCIWSTSEYTFNLPISLNISVSNELGTKVLNNVVFDPNMIVKPGPVKDFAITSTNRSAEITWSPPNTHHNMSFYVILTCQWHTQNITTFENSLQVTDLFPHTTYDVQIAVLPAQGGFLSEIKRQNFTTLQDVPEDHPMVARGAYEVTQCGANCRNITIYYKPLHDKHINGEDLSYSMAVEAIQPCPNSFHVGHGDVYKLNTSAHHISISSRNNCNIRIRITASNANGMSQGPPDAIVIPANYSIFKAPSPTVKALDDHTVHLSWKQVTFNAESYAIYWCKSDINRHGCHPKHQLNWQVLPGIVGDHILKLDGNSHFDNTKFALSAVVGNNSSPLSWARCTFDERQGGEVPKLEKTTHQKFKSISVLWSLSECPIGNHRGFVSAFNLSYCKVESCPEEGQVNGMECMDTLRSLELDRSLKDKTIEELTSGFSYMVKINSLTTKGPSEWSAPVCHTVTDTWFRGTAIVGVAIGGVCAGILVILGMVTIIYRFKSFRKWYTTGLDIKVPERHMTFSSVSSSKHLLNGQQRAATFSRGTSQTDSEKSNERQRLHSGSTDLEDDVFGTGLIEDDEIQACRSPKGYITVDSKSKHGYNRTDNINMASRALPVPGRPLSLVPEEGDSKENKSNTPGKKKSRSSSKSSKTSQGSKNSRSSVSEQSEFPPVSHVMKNPHYAAPLNNNIHAF